MRPRRAVADVGPLIALSWIDRLDLLDALFSEVLTPAAVQHELLDGGRDYAGMAAVEAAFASGRLRVRYVHDEERARALMPPLDRGEAEAIALMAQESADVLMVDERRARAAASRLGLTIIGLVGVLRRVRPIRCCARYAT